MVSFWQITKTPRPRRSYKNKTPLLRECPQKKAYCLKLLTRAPKKPHSARRRVAHVLITSIKRKTYCYLPAKGHTLQKHSVVLIRGGRRRDIPGMKYTAVRGKFDFGGAYEMRNSRSKYGCRKPKSSY